MTRPDGFEGPGSGDRFMMIPKGEEASDQEYEPNYDDRVVINAMVDRHDDGTVDRPTMTLESVARAVSDASWREIPSKFRERDEPRPSGLIIDNLDLNAILQWLIDAERIDGVVERFDNRYRYTGPSPDTVEEVMGDEYDDDYIEDYIEAYQQ